MASTYTLQQSINWAQANLVSRGAPLTTWGVNEPAVSSANLVLQTILGPPFSWRWNRKNLTLSATIQGTQDYSAVVSDFGFLEKSSVRDASNNVFEIQNYNVLGTGSEQGRPHSVAAQTDDNAGNITFRFLPVPDGVYTPSVIYQAKSTLMASLSATWSPIPDELSYIYNWGFLTMMQLYADDPRFQISNQKFVGHLLGAAQGLTEMEKNIFLQNWLAITNQQTAAQVKLQQGWQARAT